MLTGFQNNPATPGLLVTVRYIVEAVSELASGLLELLVMIQKNIWRESGEAGRLLKGIVTEVCELLVMIATGTYPELKVLDA